MSDLIAALDLMDARKIAVGGTEEGYVTQNPKTDLALVASGFDVDMTELLHVAFVASKHIAELGEETDMAVGESMVSAWLDGFMVALMYGRIRSEEAA